MTQDNTLGGPKPGKARISPERQFRLPLRPLLLSAPHVALHVIATIECIKFKNIFTFVANSILPNMHTLLIYIFIVPAHCHAGPWAAHLQPKRQNGNIARDKHGNTICRAYKTKNNHRTVQSADPDYQRDSDAPLPLGEDSPGVQNRRSQRALGTGSAEDTRRISRAG